MQKWVEKNKNNDSQTFRDEFPYDLNICIRTLK